MEVGPAPEGRLVQEPDLAPNAQRRMRLPALRWLMNDLSLPDDAGPSFVNTRCNLPAWPHRDARAPTSVMDESGPRATGHRHTARLPGLQIMAFTF